MQDPVNRNVVYAGTTEGLYKTVDGGVAWQRMTGPDVIVNDVQIDPKNPQRVLGLHFFNPVPVLPLVELVSTLVTDEAAAARTEEFASAVLGKQVVRCSDRSGFVVNALLVPYLLSAIRMVEAGFATVEDVDKAVVAGLSHPMGPLRLSDLVGLDTLKLIADKMYEEFKEPQYGPPPLLLRMVEAGRLGKKAGQGFYSY